MYGFVLLIAIVATVTAQSSNLILKVYNTGVNCNDSPVFTSGTFVGDCVRVPSLGNAALVQITGVSGRTVNVTTYYGTGVSTCNVPATGGVTVLPCTLTLGNCAFCQFQMLMANTAAVVTAVTAVAIALTAAVL